LVETELAMPYSEKNGGKLGLALDGGSSMASTAQ
jgi:hypothetical protein